MFFVSTRDYPYTDGVSASDGSEGVKRQAPRGAAGTASFLVARLMPRESRTIGVALQTLHSMRRR